MIEKYGNVPEEAMPETAATMDPTTFERLLFIKVRQTCLGWREGCLAWRVRQV